MAINKKKGSDTYLRRIKRFSNHIIQSHPQIKKVRSQIANPKPGRLKLIEIFQHGGKKMKKINISKTERTLIHLKHWKEKQ